MAKYVVKTIVAPNVVKESIDDALSEHLNNAVNDGEVVGVIPSNSDKNSFRVIIKLKSKDKV